MLPRDPRVAGNDVGGVVTCMRCVNYKSRDVIEATRDMEREQDELEKMTEA